MIPGQLFHSVEWNQYLEDGLGELCVYKIIGFSELLRKNLTSFSSEFYNTDRLSSTSAIDGSH